MPAGVLGQRALAAGDEVLRVDRTSLTALSPASGARPSEPVAPVSIVLIAVATSSMWPYSSAAMLAIRS